MPRDPNSFREQLLELAAEYETLYATCSRDTTNNLFGVAAPKVGGLADKSSLTTIRGFDLQDDLRSSDDDQPTWTCGIELGPRAMAKPALISIVDLEAPPSGLEHDDEIYKSESVKSPVNIAESEPEKSELPINPFTSVLSAAPSWNRWNILSVVSPLDKRRLCWDAIILMFAMLEFWRVPFELVFTSPDLDRDWHISLSLVITSIFGFDVIINLNTAFVDKEDRLEFRQPQVALRYLKSWFLVDVLSTIPFDLFARQDRTDGANAAAKWTRALKMLRCLKFFHALKHIASRRLQLVAPSWSRYFVISGVATLVLIVGAHINGTIFCAIDSSWTPTGDYVEALDRYWTSFWWGYITFFQRSPLPLATAEMRLLEIAVKAQSLFYSAFFSFWGFFHAMVAFQENAHFVQVKADAIMYLREHRVSYKLQRQVLQTLEETAKTRAIQRHFHDIVSEFLPQELRKRINKELWSGVILSFRLLAHVSDWSPDFIDELCGLAYQETYASKTTLFRKGDPSSATYYILSGEVNQSKEDSSYEQPPLTTGMWVGERALLLVKMRRNVTAVTMKMSTLMIIDAKPFHELLDTLGLKERYGEFLTDQLWRGLCGRCGSFGDHFPDACDKETGLTAGSTMRRSETSKPFGVLMTHVLTNKDSEHSRTSKNFQDTYSGTLGADLQGFLERHNLLHLVPPLLEMGVRSLAALERMDVEDRDGLSLVAVPKLSQADLEALSPENVSKYGKKNVRWSQTFIDEDEHFIFLSHYKVEAGTEAALMRAELEQLLAQSSFKSSDFSAPVFLDSEDLTDLDALKAHVLRSHNIVLLLTPGVISRPWVLVEIAAAGSAGIPVLPVIVCKDGYKYEMPSADVISKCATGEVIGQSGVQLINDAGFESEDVHKAVREVFLRIAVPYSPHRPSSIRRAELQALLKQCQRNGRRSLNV